MNKKVIKFYVAILVYHLFSEKSMPKIKKESEGRPYVRRLSLRLCLFLFLARRGFIVYLPILITVALYIGTVKLNLSLMPSTVNSVMIQSSFAPRILSLPRLSPAT